MKIVAFSDEYDLMIENNVGLYIVSWLISGKDVGLEFDNGLAVGWHRVSDESIMAP